MCILIPLMLNQKLFLWTFFIDRGFACEWLVGVLCTWAYYIHCIFRLCASVCLRISVMRVQWNTVSVQCGYQGYGVRVQWGYSEGTVVLQWGKVGVQWGCHRDTERWKGRRRDIDSIFVIIDSVFVTTKSMFVTTDPFFVIIDSIFVITDSVFVTTKSMFVTTDSFFVIIDSIFVITDSVFVTTESMFVTTDSFLSTLIPFLSSLV